MFRRRRITPSFGPFRTGFEDQLARAQIFFQQRRYAEAAEIFENLANLAEARGGPRAPRFLLQAGRSWLHDRKVNRGMPLLERGWNLALQTGRQDLLSRFGPSLVSELSGLGLSQSAQKISTWLEKLPTLVGNPTIFSTHHPELPLKCPSCGAPVNPPQVNWLDEVTAECDFCGSPFRGS
jgi:hypothetical protein